MLSPSHLTLINYLFILLQSFCQENDRVAKQNSALGTCKGSGTGVCDSHSNGVRLEGKTITWDRTGECCFPVTVTPPHSVTFTKSFSAGLTSYTPSSVCPATVGMNNSFTCDVWHVLVLGTAVNDEKNEISSLFCSAEGSCVKCSEFRERSICCHMFLFYFCTDEGP